MASRIRKSMRRFEEETQSALLSLASQGGDAKEQAISSSGLSKRTERGRRTRAFLMNPSTCPRASERHEEESETTR